MVFVEVLPVLVVAHLEDFYQEMLRSNQEYIDMYGREMTFHEFDSKRAWWYIDNFPRGYPPDDPEPALNFVDGLVAEQEVAIREDHRVALHAWCVKQWRKWREWKKDQH